MYVKIVICTAANISYRISTQQQKKKNINKYNSLGTLVISFKHTLIQLTLYKSRTVIYIQYWTSSHKSICDFFVITLQLLYHINYS